MNSAQAGGEFSTRAHLKLPVDAGERRFNGAHAHKQAGSHLSVCEAGCDELGDLPLPRGQILVTPLAATRQPREIGRRLFRPAGSSQLVEALEGLGERGTCCPPVARAPLDAPRQMERPRVLEGLGVHLFSRIEGDYISILGLPLLPLLDILRAQR